MSSYLFNSERLKFRNWKSEDLPKFASLNSHPEVMKFFPSSLSLEESTRSIERLLQQFEIHGHTYFAVERLDNHQFIGFIGLAYQDYPSPFTPNVDIGWRLIPEAWGKGYATEGARRCIQYAFEELKLEKLIAICPCLNQPSENVMKRIGMKKAGEFIHPLLTHSEHLQYCVAYEILKIDWIH